MAVTIGPSASSSSTASQLIVNKTFDAATVGTVPAGTMVSLTRTGTIIDKVAPVGILSSLVTLSASTASNVCPVDMGNQNFVVGYLDTTNSSAITLIACSVAGTTITAGSPVVVSASTSGTFHICRLSSTLGVIVYNDTTNSSTHTAMAFSLSGTTITLGSAQTTSTSTNTSGFSLWRTSGTTFLLTFTDSTNSNHFSIVAGSVSGTTVSVGSQVQVSTSTSAATLSNIAVLSSTSFAVVFTDTTSGTKASVVAGSLSGNTITLGSVVQNISVSTNQTPYTAVLDSTHFLFGCSNNVNFCFVAGTTVSVGTPVVTPNFMTSPTFKDTPNVNLFAASSTNAYGVSGLYITRTSDTTGTISSTGFNGFLQTARFVNSSLAMSNSGSQLMSFSGSTGSVSQNESLSINSGFAIAITNSSLLAVIVFGGGDVPLQALLLRLYPPGNPNTLGQCGITTAAGLAGQTVPLVIDGVVAGLSGLTQGSFVYAAGDGTLNCNNWGNKVGLALDSSTLLLRNSLSSVAVPSLLSTP